jgi:hypothetical protein
MAYRSVRFKLSRMKTATLALLLVLTVTPALAQDPARMEQVIQ